LPVLRTGKALCRLRSCPRLNRRLQRVAALFRLARLQLRQSREDFFAVLLRFYVKKNFADDAVGIDQKGVTCGKLGDAKIHDGIVHRRDFVLGVREQLEFQSFLGAELLVRIGVLHADAENRGVIALLLRQVALEVVGLDGASRREVFRMKIKYDPFAAEIVQTDRLGFL
jgi:hypothetical protein